MLHLPPLFLWFLILEKLYVISPQSMPVWRWATLSAGEPEHVEAKTDWFPQHISQCFVHRWDMPFNLKILNQVSCHIFELTHEDRSPCFTETWSDIYRHLHYLRSEVDLHQSILHLYGPGKLPHHRPRLCPLALNSLLASQITVKKSVVRCYKVFRTFQEVGQSVRNSHRIHRPNIDLISIPETRAFKLFWILECNVRAEPIANAKDGRDFFSFDINEPWHICRISVESLSNLLTQVTMTHNRYSSKLDEILSCTDPLQCLSNTCQVLFSSS